MVRWKCMAPDMMVRQLVAVETAGRHPQLLVGSSNTQDARRPCLHPHNQCINQYPE
jgi:hypothetical protein